MRSAGWSGRRRLPSSSAEPARLNEYTRREEVRWTLATAAVLLLAVAISVVVLATARGALVPDPAARARADRLAAQTKEAAACSTAALKLQEEIGVFKNLAKAARIEDEGKGTEDPNAALAWPAANPSHRQATQLAGCRALVEEAVGARPSTVRGWEAIGKAAAMKAPKAADREAERASARSLLSTLQDAPIESVQKQVADAAKDLAARATEAEATATSATVRATLSRGVLGRQVAVVVGVVLCLAALLVSFFSVRAASVRRAAMLIPLRSGPGGAHRGLQASTILKLAGESNGGEPGVVLGAALGGLLASITARIDADWFVVGTMGGFVVGLGFQLLLSAVHGQTRWRERAAELADLEKPAIPIRELRGALAPSRLPVHRGQEELEKPAIPIVLVLGGVRQGLEGSFLDFLNALPPSEAATTIERLAAREEEQILMAAEAQAFQPGQGNGGHGQGQGGQGQGMQRPQQQTPYPPQNR